MYWKSSHTQNKSDNNISYKNNGEYIHGNIGDIIIMNSLLAHNKLTANIQHNICYTVYFTIQVK